MTTDPGSSHEQVDDFGWIKAVQSPNWCVMPDGERPPAPERLPEDAWAVLPSAGASGAAAGVAPATGAAAPESAADAEGDDEI